MNPRLLQEITRNIEIALQEDEVSRDFTTLACLPEKTQGIATLKLKEEAVLAGLPFVPLIVYALDPSLVVTIHEEEGTRHLPDSIIATIEGDMRSLLSLERTLLNFFQHTTSIATQTSKYVAACAGKCDLLDTRKTLPGHRFTQKYAVSIGGGKNHRFHLADQILIKDNHLTFLTVKEAIRRAREKYPLKRLQIEVETLEMFEEAHDAKPDAILLDNMPLSTITKAVAHNSKGLYLEASGGIDLQNIRSYVETGVNGISIGKVTHSVYAVDMSIEIRRM